MVVDEKYRYRFIVSTRYSASDTSFYLSVTVIVMDLKSYTVYGINCDRVVTVTKLEIFNFKLNSNNFWKLI